MLLFLFQIYKSKYQIKKIKASRPSSKLITKIWDNSSQSLVQGLRKLARISVWTEATCVELVT